MQLHRIVRIAIVGLAVIALFATMKFGMKFWTTFGTNGAVNSREFAREFLTDAKAAEARYKGKTVELEGLVCSSSPLLCAEGHFSLSGTEEAPDLTIDCEAMAQKTQLPWLGKGQKVRVKGVFGQYRQEAFLGNSIVLTGCQVTELEPANAAQVTAEELTAEFLDDLNAANEKYIGDVGKEIIVEGRVVELEPYVSVFRAKLAGAKPGVQVSCTTTPQEAERLKVGQKARFKGDCFIFSEVDGIKQVTVNMAFILNDK